MTHHEVSQKNGITSNLCYYNSIVKRIMKHKVELYVAGRVFKEEVYAKNYDEARQVALARNPNARVVSVTAVL